MVVITLWLCCRPAYAKLGSLRKKLPGVPFMAVTATQNDISALQHENRVGVQLFVDPLSRPNLHATAVAKQEGTGSYNDLLNCVRGQGCGIVYVWRRVDASMIADALQRAGIRTAAYHGQLDRGVRYSLLQLWRQGVFTCMAPCPLAWVTLGTCLCNRNSAMQATHMV